MSKEFFFHLKQLGFASIDHTESGSKANATAALTSVNYFLTTNNSLHLACMTRQASGNFFLSGLSKIRYFLAVQISSLLLLCLTDIVPSFFSFNTTK